MGKSKKTIKKWIIDGYYVDEKGVAWTLMIAADGSGKTKKIKGVV